MKPWWLAAILVAGCQNAALISDFSAGYAQRVTTGGADTRGATLGWRVAAGTTKSPWLLDVQVLRFRIGDDSHRFTGFGLGVMPYVRLGSSAFIRAALGVRLIDGGTRPRGGFGMFSPYIDGGISFFLHGDSWLSFLGGLEYETRFTGPHDGLIAQATVAVTFVIFDDRDHGPPPPVESPAVEPRPAPQLPGMR